MKKNYILFIDSGIGGLSTLSYSLKLTRYNYIYYADNQYAPYGNLSKKFIQNRLKTILETTCNSFNVDLIVLACNTATTSSIKYLREKFPSKIFVGTEPAIKLAIDKNCKKPAIIATAQTISQLKSNNIKNVKLICSKKLATLIEGFYFNNNIANYFYLIKELYRIKHLCLKNDAIILGCTHYCLINNLIKRIINKPLIDGNLGVSKRIENLIKKNNLKNFSVSIKLSSENNKLKQKYKKILWQILANKNIL